MLETVDLHRALSGQGYPNILLIHGLNESLEGYRQAIGYLQEDFRVFALDLRGHGSSPWAKLYRVRDYSADVIKFIQANFALPIILAGHSLGGLVASYVAIHQPDLVHGLILEEPPFYTAQMPTLRETPFYPIFIHMRKLLQEHHALGGTINEMEALIGQWPGGFESENNSTLREVFGANFVSRLANELHRTDPQTLDPILDGTLFYGFEPDDGLPRVICPTHLMAGVYEKGGALRPKDVEKIVSLIPTCSFSIWEKSGHDIHTLHPKEYAQEIIHFAETI